MKRAIILLLAFMLSFGTVLNAAPKEGQKSFQEFNLDGEKLEPNSILVEGTNYLQLREMAELLKNSNVKFTVDWNSDEKVVEITTSISEENKAEAKPEEKTEEVKEEVKEEAKPEEKKEEVKEEAKPEEKKEEVKEEAKPEEKTEEVKEEAKAEEKKEEVKEEAKAEEKAEEVKKEELPEKMQVELTTMKVAINGEVKEVEAVLFEGRYYVRLRTLGELVGFTVQYNNETKAVSIITKPVEAIEESKENTEEVKEEEKTEEKKEEKKEEAK
ncbi:MAG: copper amine oxidase N-terminal domain-containing protein [Ezakiella sp.]|nr:copper amine oxidase N-terminal domain-containing protein [Ezakiella sp.]